MFRLLGNAVIRFWPLVLVGWLVLLVVTWRAAPPWEQVTQDREFTFLPPEARSLRGEAAFARAFPEDRLAGNVVLVLELVESGSEKLDQAKRFIGDVLEPQLRQIAEEEGGLAGRATDHEPLFADPATPPPPARRESIIARIRTPNAPGTGGLLVSQDEQALLVVVELTTEFVSRRNWPTLTKIENLIHRLQDEGRMPPGTTLALTGSAVIGRDNTQAQLRSARATEVLTIVLVVVLLVGIYRAPLLALIPLATVFLAVKVGLSLLAILANAGHATLFQGIQIYLTILAYGAGVDYCLFLIARYKEELDSGATVTSAAASAVGHVGAALAASAATVVCGIGMMLFAEFGKFRQAGFAIPLGLVVVLGATLTFTPALLCLTGRWAFWPQATGRPAARPPSSVSWWRRVAASGFPRRWVQLSHVLLRRPGTVWLATVVVMVPFAVAALLLSKQVSYNLIGNLPADAPGVAGMRVLERHFPAGLMGPVAVLLINPAVDFGSARGQALVEQMTDRLVAQKDELRLADLRSLTAPLGITPAADRAFAGLGVREDVARAAVQEEARARYLTDLGERREVGTRLDLILATNPFDRASIDQLEHVEEALRANLPGPLAEGTELHVIGPTASIRDLRTVMDRDRPRIEVLVLASVFVILVVLLRRFVVSLYLIASVLFSYYVALGVAFAVFWLLDPHGFTGIDWRVAIFLFTILIAVGEDYNIFLMARIDEEQQRFGPVRGVAEALVRTGPIISSCGLIMAGTFASLLAGSLMEMKQLGFALAFGVLLDTFVVRPILVPAFLLLLHGNRPRWPSQRDEKPAANEVAR